MTGAYLGEDDITEETGELDSKDMSLMFLHMYGGVDGAHHKDWLLDQVARILNGCPITVKKAIWSCGHTELRYSVGENEQYREWVKSVKDGEYGPDTYDYSEGIAP